MTQVRETVSADRPIRRMTEALAAVRPWPEAIRRLGQRESLALEGAWGSSVALAAALLWKSHPDRRLLVVAGDPDQLDDVADDIRVFAEVQPLAFPVGEVRRREEFQVDIGEGQRLDVLKRLRSGRWNQPLVASLPSLLEPVLSPEQLDRQGWRIERGEQLDVDALARWLVERGFHHTTAVELPGEFSVRGGIVDIFAMDWTQPVRIELFDIQVESIRRFDATSQRSLEQLDSALVTATGSVAAEGHLASYLPEGTWVLLDDLPRLEAVGQQFADRRPTARLHSVQAVWKSLAGFGTLITTPAVESAGGRPDVWPVGSVERIQGDIEQLRTEISRLDDPCQVLLVCQTQAERQRLQELFADTRPARDGRFFFTLGRLQQGFRLSEPPWVILSDAELFQRPAIRRPPRRISGKAIDSFLDLREGDLVVHLAHGIGRYRGIQVLDKAGSIQEHLELEFAEGTRIYVPASKIDLVQKYVGGRKARPQLARIGSKSWIRQKQAAAAAVLDLAAEMLELHAYRQSQSGIRFPADSPWQLEFDASFPYQETPDQLTAVAAIKADMESARPMDRLICGDVGYGKTELAMRAAFKAVDNGYQVAVLVPTTVLVEQHYHTFCQRMAEYPIAIARLSRFSTDRQQRETIDRLKKGEIDIVIGTHRLASRDVGFRNLGLLIIDEEQRFGVEIKDRLKTLRRTVDVLTLSATPIPRTLHMALTGIRDISNLETPPEDRIPVETRVTRWSDTLIREAVMHELSRNGQIFFVHNRVQDIEQVARRIRSIVPGIRMAIGHGQMPEQELEQVMIGFVRHQYDLLLATTIIESGLDIPHANTIFIDDAHLYGLADLHQLRGRVGRYKHKAYCYLLADASKSMTPQAARRLRAIEEFSDMGAGFAIAMRDLEIRGAGNLLGTEQSGHIAAVGYELYCQLLEAAVRRLRSEPPRVVAEVDIQLPGSAYLPDPYVPDIRAKIDLYRRLARMESMEAIDQLGEELADRFGAPPAPVERLLALARLRLEAAAWQVHAIHWEAPYMVFTVADPVRAEQLARLRGRRLRLVDSGHLYCPLDGQASPATVLETARSLLQPA